MSGLATQQAAGVLNQQTLLTIQLLAAGIFPTQGNVYVVNPRTGNDNASATFSDPLKTITAAYNACTTGQNDVVFLCAAGNTPALTTDYQTATLNWAKDLTHLIGVNGGPFLGQRSRIAFDSAYATASNLMTISGNGCKIAGVELYAGVASALPTGCLKITGQRNTVARCQVSGMGNSANDIASAYSLSLAGAAECTIEDSYIGLDTVTLGAAANSQIVCSAQATRNLLRRCHVATYTNHATNNNFLRAPTGSLDRWLAFEDVRFINPIDASSTNLTQAFIVASDAGGSVLLVGSRTGFVGATDWNSTDSGNVRAINGTVTNSTYGLGIPVTR